MIGDIVYVCVPPRAPIGAWARRRPSPVVGARDGDGDDGDDDDDDDDDGDGDDDDEYWGWGVA